MRSIVFVHSNIKFQADKLILHMCKDLILVQNQNSLISMTNINEYQIILQGFLEELKDQLGTLMYVHLKIYYSEH